MRIRRRTLLKLLALSIGVWSARPRSPGARAETTIRSGRFPFRALIAGPDELAQPARLDGLRRTPANSLTLAAEASIGVLTSPPLTTPFPFNALGVRWSLAGQPQHNLIIEARAAKDGGPWSAWQAFSLLEHGPAGSARDASELLFLSGDRVQIRVTLLSEGTPLSLENLELVYIDSTAGPTVEAFANRLQPFAVSRPPIITRGDWGCPQPNSSPDWPPAYQPVQKAIVHHTVTPNGADPVQVIRAIWHYHAIDLGWGDIGYNFLIDQYGNIYEGRYGGDDVVGGHALQYNWGSVGIALLGQFHPAVTNPPAGQPTGQAIDGLIALLAWKCSQRSIDPTGSGYFIDKILPNICGHRDALETECPGDYLYAWLPNVRDRTKALYNPAPPQPKYGEHWGSHTTPTTIDAGATVGVQVSVQNTGWFAWPQAGSNPVHLGYHWYRPDGSQYYQSPEDDKRSTLPFDGVAYNQWVTINALLTAPRDAGTYTLKWDMVHEGYTWFADAGNQPLAITVTVRGPVLALSQQSVVLITRPGVDSGWAPVTIANAGGGSFSFQATATSTPPGWLQVSPTSGSASSTVQIWARVGGLGPGVYQGQIDIAASSSAPVINSPQSIAVTLIVTDRLQPRASFPMILTR